MALLDRLAQAQQIVSGYENREIEKQRYATDLGFRQSAEERAMAAEERAQSEEKRAQSAEDRVAQLFPTQKAMAELGFAGAQLEFESAMSRMKNAEEAENIRKKVLGHQSRVFGLMTDIDTLDPNKVRKVRDEGLALMQLYPEAAPFISQNLSQLSSVSAAGAEAQSPEFFGGYLRKMFGDRGPNVFSRAFYSLYADPEYDKFMRRFGIREDQEDTNRLLSLLQNPAIQAILQQERLTEVDQ